MTYDPPPEPAVHRPEGLGPLVAAVILGLVGCVLPFLPIDEAGVRGYIAFPFALPGLFLAIRGSAGRRRGNALAVTGAILSGFALLFGAITLAHQVG